MAKVENEQKCMFVLKSLWRLVFFPLHYFKMITYTWPWGYADIRHNQNVRIFQIIFITVIFQIIGTSLVAQIKSFSCSAGDLGLIPGSGRSPGERSGNPLQCSCLENPTDRGAWQAAAHGVAKSRTCWVTNTHPGFQRCVACFTTPCLLLCTCCVVLRKWKHTDSHSVMLAVHGSLCTQKDKVNDVPRQNQLTPKKFKEKPTTRHDSKIRKSRDTNGNIKNCNWWWWTGEIAFCIYECIPWGMLQTVITTSLSHAGKFKLGVRNINQNFDIIGCANSFPSIPGIILFWKGAYGEHFIGHMHAKSSDAGLSSHEFISQNSRHTRHVHLKPVSPVKWFECIIDIKGLIPSGLKK